MSKRKEIGFIIPPLFYKGKYLEVLNTDKERWNRAVLKYKAALKKKQNERTKNHPPGSIEDFWS